jgi:cytosine/adenosine deaminase-related metal-dependent hydrolase
MLVWQNMLIIADIILADADKKPVTGGAIVIRYGRIAAIGDRQQLIRKYPGHRIVQLDGAVLMPGLVNVHAHLELPPLLDRIQAHDYTGWVMSLLREKHHLSLNDYRSAAKMNSNALIKSGTTTVADICTHGQSPAVLARSGLRAVVYREIISMDERPNSRLRMFPQAPRSRLINYGLSPHSPHTVSQDVLQTILRLAKKTGIRICMHVAETREETRLLQRRKSGLEQLYAAAGWDIARAPEGISSFSYLRRIQILNPTFLAVHAVQANDADISLIKRSGAAVAHCPRSNNALNVGKMPLVKFMQAGVPVGLGTDSLASVASLNLWDEMRYALRIHKASGVSPMDLLRMATLGGAQALGMDHEIGSLEPGKRADCIAVPLPDKNTGVLSSDLLRETKTCTMSMVNGRIIYRGDEDGTE